LELGGEMERGKIKKKKERKGQIMTRKSETM